jgi:tRNA-modifying protein YgfZ
VVGLSDPDRQLEAALGACAVADLDRWCRLVGTGADLLGLLHRLSTGDVSGLAPGEGRPTVLTTAKGRIVERLIALHLGSRGVLLLGGPDAAPRVVAHLKRYTFAEDTGLADRTAATFAVALIGPRADGAARAAGLPELPPFGTAAVELAGVTVDVSRTNGFDAAGWLVVGPLPDRPVVGEALLAAARTEGGDAIGAEAFEAWRILSGLPLSGRELTEDRNPLEAGLQDAVSFTKGCYVGQEVVARLNTYDKVARTIVRLSLPSGSPSPAPGDKVFAGDREIGQITSAVVPPGHDAVAALAYVKLKDLPSGGHEVEVEAASGRVAAAIVSR